MPSRASAPPPGWPGPAPGQPSGSLDPSPYASWWTRAAYYVVDLIIVWVVGLIVSIPVRLAHIAEFTIRSGTGTRREITTRVSGVTIAVIVVLSLLYQALFCGSDRGQTPGMMLLGVRAQDARTGSPIGFWRALARGIVQWVAFLVLLVPWIVDMAFPLWDLRRQTLHDKVTATVVVHVAVTPPPGRT